MYQKRFLIILCALCITPVGSAEILFGLSDHASPGTIEITVDPGQSFEMDLIALAIDAEPGVADELDSFAYRLAFPVQTFWLESNVFGAPFDNAVVDDGGFNASIPWAPPMVQITNGADFGSALPTPAIADLYRTSASEAGEPAFDDNLLIETVGLVAPMDPGDYLVTLNMLEAADAMGAFHSTSAGNGFMVHVVPEPAAGLLVLASLAWFRRPRR
jgi:hypothetical protein